MGWTTFASNGRTTRELLRERATWDCDNSRTRVLDDALVGSEWYAAVEHTDKAKGVTIVTAFVFLVRRSSRDRYDFGYKDMEESMGPYSYHCPARILDRLSEPPNDSAREWRAACRARLQRPTVKPGQRVRFAEPLKFGNGTTAAEFVFDRGSRFRIPNDGVVYRITSWRDRDYQVISNLTS